MIQFSVTEFASGESVATAFIDGKTYSITNARPQFDQIVNKLRAGDVSVVEDFDAANVALKAFHEVTDRVNIRHGVVYLDDNPVDDAIAKVIMTYLTEGNENLLPLVRFMENLEANPSRRSREQFWRFVESNGIHIDDEGFVVMYKGVYETDEPGVYRSGARGIAFVNGEKQDGHIHTRKGDIVTVPRRDVSDDPTVACHYGLHAGARSYAESFAPVLITIRANPAHVVAVPVDEQDRKVRLEQYEIMDVLTREVNTVAWADDEDDPEQDDNLGYDPYWS